MGDKQVTIKRLEELLVPTLVLVFVVLYWVQSREVSIISLIFPLILTFCILFMIIIILIRAIKENRLFQKSDIHIDSRLQKKTLILRISFIGLTIVSVLLLDFLGTALTMILLLGTIMYLLGVKKIMHIILFPIVIVFS